MYRGRLWTMRQYAGMGDADEVEQALQVLGWLTGLRGFR